MIGLAGRARRSPTGWRVAACESGSFLRSHRQVNVRNVRLLSREPGEPSETRLVEGVLVERGIALKERGGVMKVLRALDVGESFLWPSRPHLHDIRASFPDRRFASVKQPGGKYRTWRTK